MLRSEHRSYIFFVLFLKWKTIFDEVASLLIKKNFWVSRLRFFRQFRNSITLCHITVIKFHFVRCWIFRMWNCSESSQASNFSSNVLPPPPSAAALSSRILPSVSLGARLASPVSAPTGLLFFSLQSKTLSIRESFLIIFYSLKEISRFRMWCN